MGNEQLLKDIGRRICVRRKELRLTQETMAEKMEVSVQMISNLELGKKAIRPENLVKLCNVLQVSADFILCGIRSERDLSPLSKKIARLAEDEQKLIEQFTDKLLEK